MEVPNVVFQGKDKYEIQAYQRWKDEVYFYNMNMSRLEKLEAENKRLEAENQRLKAVALENQRLEAENERLQSLILERQRLRQQIAELQANK